jgi:hypothetical protein
MTNNFPVVLLVSLTPFFALIAYGIYLRHSLRAEPAAAGGPDRGAENQADTGPLVIGRKVRLGDGSVIEVRSEVTIGASGQHV